MSIEQMFSGLGAAGLNTLTGSLSLGLTGLAQQTQNLRENTPSPVLASITTLSPYTFTPMQILSAKTLFLQYNPKELIFSDRSATYIEMAGPGVLHPVYHYTGSNTGKFSITFVLTDDLIGAMGLPPVSLNEVQIPPDELSDIPPEFAGAEVGNETPYDEHVPVGANDYPDGYSPPDESDYDEDAFNEWLYSQYTTAEEIVPFNDLYAVKAWLDLLTEPLFFYGTPPGVLIQWGSYQKLGLVSKVTAKVISMYKNGLPRILEVKMDLHSLDPRLLYGVDDGALVTNGD